VPICREIEERTGREVAVGSVYATLERLEENGLVSSRLGEPTAERGGRAKKYFRVSSKGLKEVRQAQRVLTSLWKGLPQLERGMG
jgi:PadR family transcriptional regulator, regulatory protein PadR